MIYDTCPLRVWKHIILRNIPELVYETIQRYGINNKIELDFSDVSQSAVPSLKLQRIFNSQRQITDTPILVFSENELIQIIMKDALPDKLACISIRNPNEEIPEILFRKFEHLLELKFYDAYSIEHLGPRQKIKRIPKKTI